MAMDSSGAVHSGWHHVGQYPTGGLKDADLLTDLVEWIQAFTAGNPQPAPTFTLPDGPPFYRRCWEICREIPPGQLLTYRQLASRAGRDGAARAAGAAMRHNPTPMFVPCHRVVRQGGALGGFAGHSTPGEPALLLKQELLELEGCCPNNAARRGILSHSQVDPASH